MVLERLDADNCEDRLQFVLHRARYDFVLSRLTENQDVLEIGTGAGVFARELQPRCGSYIGVEFDSEACISARQKCGGKAEIIQADARQLPFKNDRFTFIVCLEVLEHLGDWRSGIKNIHRCLNNEGMAIISVPYRRVGGKNEGNHYHLYEPGEFELVSEFRARFNRVEVYYQYFQEQSWMTLVRRLHLRRLFGLKQLYADLSAGKPEATARLHIGKEPKGMNTNLILVASQKRQVV
jgi:ubiquinone/menaquinone biosynthesis C-methylase UbiE